MSKAGTYQELVALRKACRACATLGLANPSEVGNGEFDSEHVGPWSIWQHNRDARVMVIGQDWGDVEYFVKWDGYDDPKNPTNRNLRRLASTVGVELPPPPTADGPDCEQLVFLTNAVLCLKCERGLQAPVKREWFDNCGARFLRPLLELVAPRVVVTLGWWAMDTVLMAFGRLAPKHFREAVDNPNGVELLKGTQLFSMYHPGNRILHTHRHWEQQVADWAKLRDAL